MYNCLILGKSAIQANISEDKRLLLHTKGDVKYTYKKYFYMIGFRGVSYFTEGVLKMFTLYLLVSYLHDQRIQLEELL